MEARDEAQKTHTSEIVLNATAYRIKSILPNNGVLRDILLRVAVSEAVNQVLYT